MLTTNQKIGQLIYQIRQDRRLTQAEFARRLGTSQSAVNRIEHGRQNLSLETLARISDVLNKQIISLGTGVNLRVEGGHELSGKVEVKTSKNAAVSLLFAAMLNRGTTRLMYMPRIEEVNRIIEVLQSIGVQIKWINNTHLEIKPPQTLNLAEMNQAAASQTRSLIMMLGPLIHLFNEFKMPPPGGCKLGSRTILPHVYALEEFGVKITQSGNQYSVSVNKKSPKTLTLYEMSDTTTENALMAAAGGAGEVVIKGASANYMVQDMCFFLKKLGVKIDGIGTNRLTVKGIGHVKKNITYYPSEDPIEAMTFICAAVTTNSKITIARAPIDFLELELFKLKTMGLNFDVTKHYKADNGQTELADIAIYKHNGELKAPVDKIHPNTYPGINIDNLPYFVPIAAVAKGTTLIHDWVYDERALYYTELRKLNADVTLADPHRAIVTGPTNFTAGDITCPPALRPAVILLIAMLAAPGVSMLRNVYSINRGYEDLAERLNALGAQITVLNEM